MSKWVESQNIVSFRNGLPKYAIITTYMDRDDVPEINSIWDEARNHIERGDYDKALEIYRYIIVRYADDPVAIEYANAYLGDVCLTIRRLDLAEQYFSYYMI